MKSDDVAWWRQRREMVEVTLDSVTDDDPERDEKERELRLALDVTERAIRRREQQPEEVHGE